MRIRVHRWPALVAALGLILAGGALSASNAFASEGEPCPNAQLRQESKLNQLTGRPYSTELPDCRAYEQVSPPEKGQALVNDAGIGALGLKPFQQAAADGEGVMYGVTQALPGDTSSSLTNEEAAFRGTEGWLTSLLAGPQIVSEGEGGAVDVFAYFSPNLTCGTDETEQPMEKLASGAPAPLPTGEGMGEVMNLYAWSSATGAYTLVSNTDPANRISVKPGAYQVYGANADCSRIVFATEYQLLAGAPESGDGLYEWDEGTLRLVSRLPDETVTAVRHLPSEESPIVGAVSRDASRIFFTATSDSGADSGGEEIFMKEGQGPSVEVSQSQTATPAGFPDFQAASSEGSHVLFIANYGLTANSSQGGSTLCFPPFFPCDLYDYDVQTKALTDISADTNVGDAEGANVVGVLGISEDGSYVYFSALGQLPASNSADSVSEIENERHEEENVYVWHDGQLGYVATLPDKEAGEDRLSDTFGQSESRVTNGQHLLFMSRKKLTNYDNESVAELYLYSTQAEKVVCVSCDPDGARPLGPAETSMVGFNNGYASRNLSEDGDQVFFTSHDPLAAGATAGVNAYEWEHEGVGSCTAGEAHAAAEYSGGCIYLLGAGGTVLDASSDGNEVFITSRFPFVEQDTDGAPDVYEARVDGGFPAPTAVECSGEECQGELNGPLSFSSPGSTGAPLVGNVPPSVQAKPSTGVVQPKGSTRVQRLAKALTACRRKSKKKRAACERQAEKKYGAKSKSKAKHKGKKSSGKGSK
jgi:hypothetical protein